MGDAGSGYWIGRAALEAVMRAYDGRGPQTALTPVVLADFPALEDAYIELQADDERVGLVHRPLRDARGRAGRDRRRRRAASSPRPPRNSPTPP